MSPAEPRLLSRFLMPSERRRLEAGVAEGRLAPLEQLDVLAPEGLSELARWSLLLLVASLAFFIALDIIAARFAWLGRSSPPSFQLNWLVFIGLIVANLAAYVVVLPLHEALHAAAILALGGTPRFGLRLPLALYCTAPGQLFTRDGYLVVAGAPLAVISLVGIVAVSVRAGRRRLCHPGTRGECGRRSRRPGHDAACPAATFSGHPGRYRDRLHRLHCPVIQAVPGTSG